MRFISFWVTLAAVSLFLSRAHAQTPGGKFQSQSFQYFNGAVPASSASNSTPGWNGVGLPKFFTLSITGTASSPKVALQGSLDNANWSNIAITNSVAGNVSNSVPMPMIYYRVLNNMAAGADTTVTATVVGSW